MFESKKPKVSKLVKFWRLFKKTFSRRQRSQETDDVDKILQVRAIICTICLFSNYALQGSIGKGIWDKDECPASEEET